MLSSSGKRVLSLFDGISCARVAFGDCEYYSSEIDKYAIQVSTKNFPDIIRLGDVTKVEPIPDLFLLIGGSPCTDLSIAKKDRQGLQGSSSKLFYEYLRILRESKPKYFILENVNSMSKESRNEITKEMGVEPIMIDASLVSAQSRKRLFWTNIPVKGLPDNYTEGISNTQRYKCLGNAFNVDVIKFILSYTSPQ